MAETYKLDIDTLERNGTSACLAATRAMIARIRELERDKADWMKANAPGGWIDDLRRASQPGGGKVEPRRGEIWHVRLKDASALATLEMLEVTPATILARKPGDYYETRYARCDVDFVERAAPSAGNGGAEGV